MSLYDEKLKEIEKRVIIYFDNEYIVKVLLADSTNVERDIYIIIRVRSILLGIIVEHKHSITCYDNGCDFVSLIISRIKEPFIEAFKEKLNKLEK